jgi:multidrug efflux pump subunit AcrA (membrane-fusion protein)
MNRNRIKRLVLRLLSGLLGVVLALALFFLLGGHQGQLEEPVRKAIAALPADIRDQVERIRGGAPPADEERLRASGVIQAESVSIASEFGGRIVAMPAGEGDSVAAGDLLVQLDTTLLDAQIEAAQALVGAAEAGLAQAQAGVRPGQVAIAEAQLTQAQAGRDAAAQAISDTITLVENPQDILLQIAVTHAQAEAAEHRVAQAEALRDAVEIAKNKFEELRGREGHRRFEVASGSVGDLPGVLPPEVVDQISEALNGTYTYQDWELHIQDGSYALYTWRDISLPLEFHLMPNQWWQAWVGVNAAAAQRDGLQSSLYHLTLQQQNPQLLEAQVDEAVGALAQSEAHVALAQAQVEGMQAGASPEQLAVLESQLAQAQAAVDSLETVREMRTLTSPLDGVVVSVAAYPGEVAAQGATILTVADLANMSLVVYVPENRVGQVAVGHPVRILVDSLPDRPFAGEVSRIADQAEFTPRNVATQEERVNLVFAIEIRVDNQGGLLKPGMPADVLFEGGRAR